MADTKYLNRNCKCSLENIQSIQITGAEYNTSINYCIDKGDITGLYNGDITGLYNNYKPSSGFVGFYGTDTHSASYTTGANSVSYIGVNVIGGEITSTADLGVQSPVLSPELQIRDIIRSRTRFVTISRRRPVKSASAINEIRARQTLKRLIGESRFHRYISDGFLSVKAKSGRVYQIFAGTRMTNVYQQGKMIERLCVELLGNYPPTDALIMRYLLILDDEAAFRTQCNVHNALIDIAQIAAQDTRPLLTIYNELKQAA